MTNLATIILFAYNRPWHTEQVLNALKNNELADKSHLVIFVDGPKSNATKENVDAIQAVREVVKKERWCASVEYHFAEKNIGCRNSIIAGISQVLLKNDAAIILEDDIVTAPCFLKYMNSCLNFYKNKKTVFSISGMSPNENKFSLPHDYNYDVFFSHRQLNSGWATWSDRWNSIDWNMSDLKNMLNDKRLLINYNRGGDDLLPMIIEQIDGKSDAWDIQFTYNHFINHSLSVIPRFSYIDNIGGDGTGTHHLDTNASLHFDLRKAIPTPRLPEKVYEDKDIINAFYNAYCKTKRPLWQKLINRISRMFGGKNVFVIKKKIYA